MSKAKEKANELVNKFDISWVEFFSWEEDGFINEKNIYKELSLQQKKQCAFICVEEILNNGLVSILSDERGALDWQEVKQEIEKI